MAPRIAPATWVGERPAGFDGRSRGHKVAQIRPRNDVPRSREHFRRRDLRCEREEALSGGRREEPMLRPAFLPFLRDIVFERLAPT